MTPPGGRDTGLPGQRHDDVQTGFLPAEPANYQPRNRDGLRPAGSGLAVRLRGTARRR